MIKSIIMKFKKVIKKIYKKFSKRQRIYFGFIVLVCFVLIFIYLFKDLPSPTKLSKGLFPVSTQILDRNGKLLYEIYSEQNRTPIKLSELPPYVKQTTISIEDKDFYKQGAFAFSGIIRAGYNIIFKKNLQGGSTITQQLIKTVLLTPERTIKRKIREAVLASVTEILYSKDQILEMYLNHIPYGGTAYGIEQASKKYFNKNASKLTLAEAALLAGLPAAPTKYSPFGASPQLAKIRQQQVLARMVEDKYLTKEQAQLASNEEIKFATQKDDFKAPHFVMYVKELLEEKYGTKMVEQGGLRVITSLDLSLQNFAQEVVASEAAKLQPMKVSNGSTLITKTKTGEILAMVGSKDYFAKDIDGNVNLTTSLRQPGSSIKPINYAVGLIKGYTPATIFIDSPTCFNIPGQPLYCPHNYDGKFHGLTEMRFSLGNSYNIPAVKMLALNGVQSMIATASAMGITTWTDPSRYGLSLTLGGGEVKMIDMAVAFGVFANQGVKIDLHPILKVSDYTGKIYEEINFDNDLPQGTKVLTPEVTYLISHILLDNNARTDAFGASSKLVIPNKAVSVKTGTTDDLRDNWTIGYTPSYLVVSWVGNNDNSPMHPYLVSGITGAAPIWNKIMSYVLKDIPDEWPKKPENIVGVKVCPWLDIEKKSDPNKECDGRYEYVIKGTEKDISRAKVEKKEIWIDKETQRPPEPGKTDNLELKEHIVISDGLTKDYCLDCPHEGEKPTIITLQ